MKMKSFHNFPTPFWNYVDSKNKDFLDVQYSSQLHKFKLSEEQVRENNFESVCDLSNLDAYLETLRGT